MKTTMVGTINKRLNLMIVYFSDPISGVWRKKYVWLG